MINSMYIFSIVDTLTILFYIFSGVVNGLRSSLDSLKIFIIIIITVFANQITFEIRLLLCISQ